MVFWQNDTDVINLAPDATESATAFEVTSLRPTTSNPRRISNFGLGYVGAVSAACFASIGHTVVGIDINETKRRHLSEGKSPIIEPGLDELMMQQVQAGRLAASADVNAAIAETDISMICVGTPSSENGSVNLDIVRNVTREIGQALRQKQGDHLVIFRSTIPPGSMRNVIIPILEQESGRRCGENLQVAHNPEFLRESTAMNDFFSPPKTVIGADDPRAAEQVAELYEGIQSPVFVVPYETSEMVKYVDNTWHALKVAFANEIGNVCQSLKIDSHELMNVFCADTKLNISPYYLKPGFAFGGSCLPKDVRALTYLARQIDVEMPIISNILASNRRQVERAIDRVIGFGQRDVAMLGISFKSGTDDLRESPQVELIERLLGKGFNVKIYDPSVNLSALTGVNRQYIEKAIPHIGSIMMTSLRKTVAAADVIIIGNASFEFKNIEHLLSDDQTVLDLVRLWKAPQTKAHYVGINW